MHFILLIVGRLIDCFVCKFQLWRVWEVIEEADLCLTSKVHAMCDFILGFPKPYSSIRHKNIADNKTYSCNSKWLSMEKEDGFQKWAGIAWIFILAMHELLCTVAKQRLRSNSKYALANFGIICYFRYWYLFYIRGFGFCLEKQQVGGENPG